MVRANGGQIEISRWAYYEKCFLYLYYSYYFSLKFMLLVSLILPRILLEVVNNDYLHETVAPLEGTVEKGLLRFLLLFQLLYLH